MGTRMIGARPMYTRRMFTHLSYTRPMGIGR